MRMSNPEAMNKSSDCNRYIVTSLHRSHDSTVQRFNGSTEEAIRHFGSVTAKVLHCAGGARGERDTEVA